VPARSGDLPSGTVIADAAEELVRKLASRLGHRREAAE